MNDMINDFFAIFYCHHTTKKIILHVVLCKTQKLFIILSFKLPLCDLLSTKKSSNLQKKMLKEGCFEVLLTSVADFEYTYNGILSYQVWLEFLEI